MLTKSIALSGFMATGKSTVGAILSQRTGLPVWDTDAILSEREGIGIGPLWLRLGEEEFRRREAELVLELLQSKSPGILSLGGGTLTQRALRRRVLEEAFVVTLVCPPEDIVARGGGPEIRPNLYVGNPLERARHLLALRREAYAECHLTLDTSRHEPAEVAARVLDHYDPKTVAVALGTRSYRVEVVRDEPSKLLRCLRELSPSSVVVVTDTNVWAARGSYFEPPLDALGVPWSRVTLTPGEEYKTLASVQHLWDSALDAGVDRRSIVLAAGGGVVGDMAGFAASTLLRGIRCVQCPTTLLAMVDSSVGGKTGFDTKAGKNLIGSFHQPSHVVIDVSHLETLDERQTRAGMAEVVKIALTSDAELFRQVETYGSGLGADESALMTTLVQRSVLNKARIVADDELEQGQRALLNLGHTVGHALEAASGYTRFLHGEAVSLGLVAELRFACEQGWTPEDIVVRTLRVLEDLRLPTRVEANLITRAHGYLPMDKKRTGASIEFPVVEALGKSQVRRCGLELLERAFR